MAEVLEVWPQQKAKAEPRFSYPWDQWMAMDEDGIGDIWLAEQGIDWPADANAMRFRSNLATRAKKISAARKRTAKTVLKNVDGKMRKVLDYEPVRVKVRIVSDHQVAFQFYEGTEPPEEPTHEGYAVPKRVNRRKPIHRAVTRRTIENTKELIPA